MSRKVGGVGRGGCAGQGGGGGGGDEGTTATPPRGFVVPCVLTTRWLAGRPPPWRVWLSPSPLGRVLPFLRPAREGAGGRDCTAGGWRKGVRPRAPGFICLAAAGPPTRTLAVTATRPPHPPPRVCSPLRQAGRHWRRRTGDTRGGPCAGGVVTGDSAAPTSVADARDARRAPRQGRRLYPLRPVAAAAARWLSGGGGVHQRRRPPVGSAPPTPPCGQPAPPPWRCHAGTRVQRSRDSGGASRRARRRACPAAGCTGRGARTNGPETCVDRDAGVPPRL